VSHCAWLHVFSYIDRQFVYLIFTIKLTQVIQNVSIQVQCWSHEEKDGRGRVQTTGGASPL
jgi:hypothetical protein